MTDDYEGQERRHDDRRGEEGIILRTMDATQKLLATHNTEELERMRLLDARINDLSERMTSIVVLIEKYMETHNHVLNAFPGGDLIGHKEAHQAWIEETKRRAEFWRNLKTELAKWGLIGFTGWVLLQLWTGALKGPQ
jgi:hypothetical protein